MPPNWRLADDGKIHRKGRKRYANGDVYDGEFVDGKREGKGAIEYHTGNRYVGEFMDNMFHGFGTYVWAEFAEDKVMIRSRRHEGHWARGKRNGHGVFIIGNGDVYTGNFKNDLYHGQGEMVKANGDKLAGEWECGKLNGEANIEFANGDRYTGGFFGGKFHGKGRYVYGFGRGWYEGEYKHGKQHGTGLRVFSNNNRYEGSFKHGECDGDGIMEFHNGASYIGQWQAGFMHGRGVLQHIYGDRYEGEFMKGYFFGRGRFTWADGGFYEGEYIALRGGYEHGVEFPDPNGKRNGRGARHWVSGDRYDGEWKDDMMHGEGIITKASGGRFLGTFREGKKVNKGTETWGNKVNVPFVCPMGYRHEGRGFCTYEGSWWENHFHGEGVFTCMDNRSYTGQWRRGRRHGWGTMIMCPLTQRGDPRRMDIGGMGGLYRPVVYRGQWDDGTRQGKGTIEYANGTKVSGDLVNGVHVGHATWMFPSGHVRIAQHSKTGEREAWLDEHTEEHSKRIAGTKTFALLQSMAQKSTEFEEQNERRRRLVDARRRQRQVMAAAMGTATPPSEGQSRSPSPAPTSVPSSRPMSRTASPTPPSRPTSALPPPSRP